MPELPEVQTVINYLQQHLLDRTITTVVVHRDKLIKNVSAPTFIKTLASRKIVCLARKGKYILLHLSDNLTIVAHLRMEGKFFIDAPGAPARPHDYIWFNLDDGRCLVFNDSRQFGTFHLVQTHQLHLLRELQKVAPDPLEINFDLDDVTAAIQRSSRNIKTLLLDQSITSGLGNIYANEVLFMTGINPLTPGKALAASQVAALAAAAREVLTAAIKFNGTTIHSFKFGDNQSGAFVKFLQVHFRAGQPCRRCRTPIVRFKDHGRSIYCCPRCQHLDANALTKPVSGAS